MLSNPYVSSTGRKELDLGAHLKPDSKHVQEDFCGELGRAEEGQAWSSFGEGIPKHMDVVKGWYEPASGKPLNEPFKAKLFFG